MRSELVAIKSDDFIGTVHHEGTELTAKLKGTADYAALEGLDKLLSRTHAEAKRLGARKVVIDLRELEFMNSSSFKVFVTWLALLQELATDKQYRIHFRSNPNLHWQRRSLAALSCFAVDLVAIET